MIKEDVFVHDPRRAGDVKRYHAQTHVVTQTVASHSWNLVRIATTIWPDIPRHIILYCIYHDIAEGCVGDLPYTTKLRSKVIKDEIDGLESESILAMSKIWQTPILPALTNEEKKFVKAVEYVEFAEYSWVEKNLGNRYIQVVLDRVLPLIHATKLADTYLNTRFHTYVKARRLYEEGI
jgi:5'-deoxynucleotidase YfbR-like HD superfamily hydrolase